MKNNISKKILIINLLCILLFCSSCNKRGDKTQEEIWSKHAFLLEEDDILFVSMPENWSSYLMYEVSIYVPDKKTSDRPQTYSAFHVTTPYEFLKYEEEEKFVFADGQAGKKYAIVNENRSVEDGKYAEYILSADEKYMFSTSYYYSMDDAQYKHFLEYSEQFYSSMIFQKGQIGLPQENLTDCEKVKLHIGKHFEDKYFIKRHLCLDITIPEGLFFEVKEERKSYSLFLYLDETKENYIEICSNTNGERLENILKLDGKILTDQTYEEDAKYTTYTLKNDKGEMKKIREYQFLSQESIFVEISVSEEDEDMLAIATDMVKTIKFR